MNQLSICIEHKSTEEIDTEEYDSIEIVDDFIFPECSCRNC